MTESVAIKPIVYRPGEVAQLLQISIAQVYRMAASGTMPSVRYGRSVRVPAWWVDEQRGKVA
jgi:excisionase family DNA binding protein